MSDLLSRPAGWAMLVALIALVVLRLPYFRRVTKERAPVIHHVWKKSYREAMSAVVSLVVLASALWVIVSASYSGDARNWAFGAVGTIVGYWLNQSPGGTR